MNTTPDLPPRRLGLLALLALAVATLIFVTVVLPAEFGRDPTGFGKLTGLYRRNLGTNTSSSTASLAAPTTASNATTGPARVYSSAFRSDTFSIPLDFGDELEFKVRMAQGATFVYSWNSEGLRTPYDLYADFHSEVLPHELNKVVEYRQEVETAANGSLIAPFDGVHGWFFQNRGEDKIVVRLKLSGFYELVPDGEYGNERGIAPGR